MTIFPVSIKHFSQIGSTVIACLSLISYGMHFGWTAPVLPYLHSKDSHIKITGNDEVWLEATYLLSGLLGIPLSTYLANKLGRKILLSVASSILLVAWVIIALANRVEYLYLARSLSGITANIINTVTPMYVSEIADSKFRGFLLGFGYLMLLLGILLVYSIVPFTPYFVPSIIGSMLTVLQFMLFPLMPESPYFLVSKGKRCEAKNALEKIRGEIDSLDDELKEITEVIERQKEETKNFKSFFLNKTNRKVLLIVIILTGFQHFTGFTVIAMNTHTILIESGSVFLDSKYTGIISSVFFLVGATICTATVDRIGRKLMLIVAGLFSGISLLALCIYFYLKSIGVELESVNWIPVVAIVVYGITFQLGMGFIPIMLTAELFLYKFKAAGMALGDGLFIVFSSCSIIFYQNLASSYGIYVPLFIFSLLSILGVIYTIFCVPETKGKSLEEIQLMLENQNVVHN